MFRPVSSREHRLAALGCAAILLAGCGGSQESASSAADGPLAAAELLRRYDTELPTVRFALDPEAGDPGVPAELGGPGFTGEGWQTNLEFPAMGDPRAVKGGTLTTFIPDWPATLRMTGKDWNTAFNYRAIDLLYESLLGLHSITLEFVPGLATHWWISEDKKTYRYRINPKARWSDGSEVTAADVVASFKLRMDPSLLDPSNIMTYGKLHEPRAISKYIVEIEVKQENWRNFLYFSGMRIFPAKEVSIPGSEYLDKYQFAYTANTGPYIVHPEDIDTGKSVTLRRRHDYWDRDNPAWTGLSNIDAIKFVVVKDYGLAFEKVKKGELDYFPIPKAQWWAEVLPELDAVKRGLLLRRKFYNDAPIGTSGIAINMQRPPLDDLRVRKALQHLYDRRTMIEKLYFNEYVPLTSYWQGGLYQNPANQEYAYDEVAAVELLEQAGWTETSEEGYRVKGGRELGFSLIYRSSLSERSLTVFQEACKRAGIRLDLQLLTPASHWKNVREKEYELASVAWGAVIFPNPETSFHSRLAGQKDNNNITSFADPRVDELCAAYDREYDVGRRVELIREIDGIVYGQHPYVLGWYNPAQRVILWNKFGMPESGVSRFLDQEDNLYATWWVDPEKEKALAEAIDDPSKTLPAGETKNRFWEAWNLERDAGDVASGR